MFSIQQKREISEAVQKILRKTNHPELPKGEIQFQLHVDGAEDWSWADIENNGAVTHPDVNPWNEQQDTRKIKLAECSHYKDGGTIEYRGSDGKHYFLDRRIKTTTRGLFYDRYPGDKGARIVDSSLVEII